jgi:NTE family protein
MQELTLGSESPVILRRWIQLLIFVVLPINLLAQDSLRPQTNRPRVGLALGGGGALGLAHIGVLQYFEEHHIPIDAVAGTSMGGLIGGLYATGLDATQLRSIVSQADWDSLLSTIPPMRGQPVVEKQSWNSTFGDVTLRLGRKFSLPVGLNPGEALALLFSRYTAEYGGISSFDELPTPFRCVATDLVSGEAVVLDRGPLAKALRATMAIPAVFTPVAWDDKILVDGGVVENLPVEPLLWLGADKTIAVRLLGPQPKAGQFRSLTSILQRSVSVSIDQNERRSAKLADLVIEIDTKDIRGTDYEQYEKLIQAGYAAANSHSEQLKQFELPPEQWSTFIAARRTATRLHPSSGRVAEVVAQNSQFQENAESELRRKLGTGPVSEQKLADTVSGIVAATGVPSASYEWDSRADGYRVEFLPRPDDRVLVRPSFRYNLSAGEPSRTELRLALSVTAADAYKSRTLGSITIGYDPGIRAEYYHPFDGSGYFVAPGFLVERKHINVYQGPNRLSHTRDRFALYNYAGIGTWKYWQVRAGVQSGYDSYSERVVTDGVTAKSHGFTNPELTWLYNSLDAGPLPRSGTRIDGSAGYSFRNNSFPYLRNEFSWFRTPYPHFTIFSGAEFGTSFGTKLDYYQQFTAGGSGELSAFRYQEFHSNSMIIGDGGLVIHTPRLPSLPIHPEFPLWYEAGRFDLGSGGWKTHQSSNAGVFFSTRVGAAGIAVGFDEKGRARFRLVLGTLAR